MTKLVTCTFCGQTMDSDDCIKHGIEKHNHYMAKTIQQKLEEIQRLSGNPNLKISDIVNDDLMQSFLNISKKIREDGR